MQECWLNNNCNHKDCDKPICLRKYKLDYLYDNSLLSQKQRMEIKLFVDEDGTDLEEFKELAELKRGIELFVNEGRNLYIYSKNPGNGKAQPDEAQIYTPSGYTTMGAILPGQSLYGDDGEVYKVENKFDRGNLPVYKVLFHDGTSTECCNEHLWTVYDRYKKVWETVELSKLLQTGLKYKGNTHWRYEIPVAKPLKTDDIKLPINSYLLGYILGDGSIGKADAISIAVSATDAAFVIPYLNSILPKDYIIAKARGKYCYVLKIANHNGIKSTFGNFKNEIKTILANFRLLGTNSYTKFIPEQCFKASYTDRLQLLQGLMDTDGNIYKAKKGGIECSFATTSAKLANDLALLVESLGGTCSIRERQGKTYSYKGQKLIGHAWYNCTLKMPVGVNPFKLPRKAAIYEQNYQSQQKEPYRTIKAIEFIGYKHCYCIKTTNPTGLYLTNNLIVTHNTSWSIKFIQAYFDKIWPKIQTDNQCKALFISIPRFILELKDNISKKSDYISFIKENIMSADLVVWDDIATKMATNFEIDQLLGLIDGRIALGKANIYTSNMTPEEMPEVLGSRLASRVCQYSTTIKLNGADKRKFAVQPITTDKIGG